MKLFLLKSLVVAFILPVFLASFMIVALPTAQCETKNVPRLVEVQYLRSDSQQEHIFLNPQQSVTYNASSESDSMNFDSFYVQANSTNPSFLTELNTDLYIESYNYFGGLGAWTSNSNFTITNPTVTTQEVFLKIVRNYQQTAYATDTVTGSIHSIEFTSGPASDRVFVRWGFFAAMSYVEINGSQVDFSTPNLNNPVRLEFLPTYCSFQIPPNRIQGTHFLLRLEEKNYPPPAGYSYISAFLLNHTEVTLAPNQLYLFTIPNINGWTFDTAAAYTNLTPSLYSKPYPFQLVNMSVWDASANPLLATALDVSFGVRNISNQTYSLSFDVLFYYWENQSGMTFMHQIIGTDSSSVTHEISVNVSDATIGSALGLTGQYLTFQTPGKTVSYNAPNPIGKYELSYIPLRAGSYALVTQDERIVANVTTKEDDLRLSNELAVKVTYDGAPYAGAIITVTQKGTFTSRSYSAITDQNGDATITVYSNGPESDQLVVTVTKNQFNYTQQTVIYFVGASWIAAMVVVAAAVIVLAFLFVLKKRGTLHKQPYDVLFCKSFKSNKKMKVFGKSRFF